jgi:hypothetical protein
MYMRRANCSSLLPMTHMWSNSVLNMRFVAPNDDNKPRGTLEKGAAPCRIRPQAQIQGSETFGAG